MKLVPLIPSEVAGPLGIKHLPRLWLKASLQAKAMLHDEYPGVCPGYDSMLLDMVGINMEAFKTYIAETLPSLPECEAWIQANGHLDPAKIAAFNRQVDQYHHDDATRKEILDAAGIDDDGSYPDAPTLNALDDWTLFHRDTLKG